MKLFVDDMRACPEGWTLARTVTEAIRILATQGVDEVSLDHDIGCRLVDGQEHTSNETFEPVAWFIAALRAVDTAFDESLQTSVPGRIRIHTSNVAAGRRMADIIGIAYNNEIYDPRDYS